MTTVDPRDEGGVASYVRAIHPYLTDSVTTVLVGSRPGESGATRGVWRLARDTARFCRTLWCRRFDVVHLNPSLDRKALLRDGLLLAAARIARVPTVVFFHGWVPECEEALRRPIARALFASTFLRADHLIVLGSSFEATLRGWGRTGPVSVLTTVVDEPDIRAASVVQRSTTAPVRLLFLARLDRRKGAATALEAHRLLRERGRNVELVIAGDGPEFERLKKRVTFERIPATTMPGYVSGSEKAALLRGSDILLFPTEYGEGLPIAVLEAMVFGLAIVTRPVGGLPDVLADGETGLMTTSTSASAFAALVERLIDEPEMLDRVRARNGKVAATEFSAALGARRLSALWRSV